MATWVKPCSRLKRLRDSARSRVRSTGDSLARCVIHVRIFHVAPERGAPDRGLGEVRQPNEGMSSDELEPHLREWAMAACAAWGYPAPNDAYYARLRSRLPLGLRRLIAHGLIEGLIEPRGLRFTLRDLPGKGPYAWFSQRPGVPEPATNWEYFVQVAEFVRLHRVAAAFGLQLRFEHGLMDLALYRADELLVYCEVKVRASQAHDLVKKLSEHERLIDGDRPDRGDDTLRKAKYIARHRPAYFACVAIGVRLEYRVDYPSSHAFRLTRDLVPWF